MEKTKNEETITKDGIIVKRSTKRKRTIGIKLINGQTYLYVPINLKKEDELKYIEWAKKKAKALKRKKELIEKNADKILEERAKKLNQKYFNGELKWNKICFSTEQNSRMFGNYNYKTKTIRISDRLIKMPKFVMDYVIVHELAHIKVPWHNKEFWKIVKRYKKTERAIGYLMAIRMKD